MSLAITNVVDYTNNAHYEYILEFFGPLTDPYLYFYISYLFHHDDVIKKEEPDNWPKIMKILDSNKASNC